MESLERPDEEIFIEQAKIIDTLTDRIDNALSYLDWYAAIMTDVDEPYVEQLIKILEGQEVEH